MNLLERTPPDPLGRPDLVDAVDLDPRVHADVDPGVRADPLFQDPFGRPEQDPLARPLTLVFADGTGSVFLADMTGDGLADIVRVRLGEVAYWPNLGG